MSNVNNPTRGLQRVWQRLGKRYGSPEMVESALKQKNGQFTKVNEQGLQKTL